MFAVTISPSDLESAFNSVDALVDECKMHISEEGVSVTAVDPANVGMVDLTLPRSVFESYEADDHTLGLPLERFLNIVHLFSQNDTDAPARIFLNEETRKVRLECGGLDYTMSLIDPDSVTKEPEIPQIDLAADITLDQSDFDRSIKASNMVSDYVMLGATSDGEFYVSAEGDTDDVKVELDGEDLIEINAGDAESLFSLEYLKEINKAIPANTPVTLELGPEYPIMINFLLIDGQADVLFMLAPRISSD
jgi:proliferating cell nuclear antigen